MLPSLGKDNEHGRSDPSTAQVYEVDNAAMDAATAKKLIEQLNLAKRCRDQGAFDCDCIGMLFQIASYEVDQLQLCERAWAQLHAVCDRTAASDCGNARSTLAAE